MALYYISDNKVYKNEKKNSEQITLDRIENYKENSRQISRKNEWKNSGAGARFTGTAVMTRDIEKVLEGQVKVTGLCDTGSNLVYSVKFDGVSGIYTKSYDEKDKDENLIISSQDFSVSGVACKKEKLAASLDYANGEKHIAIFKLPSANYNEITDGDTREEYPFWSQRDNKLYFSSSGIARDENGQIAAFSPKSIMKYNFDKETIETVLESEEYDYIFPQTDNDGNLYCIRQPYKEKESAGNILIDVLLFPVRLIKAIFGFLNVFSILFGGESLHSGEKQSGQYKSKQKSEKDIIFENNIINADKNMKYNSSKGDKYPGIIPRSWELIKINSDDSVTVIKSGVLNFKIVDDEFYISNGKHIIRIDKEGNEKHICKADMAIDLNLV